MLDFNPQPLDILRMRYHESVSEIFDAEEVVCGFATRPGELPRHVFDFEDGLRLIVSRDRLSDHNIVLHISASFTNGTFIHGRLAALAKKSIENMQRWFMAAAIEHWRAVSLSDDEPSFIGLSEGKQIPHWHIPQYREPIIH